MDGGEATPPRARPPRRGSIAVAMSTGALVEPAENALKTPKPKPLHLAHKGTISSEASSGPAISKSPQMIANEYMAGKATARAHKTHLQIAHQRSVRDARTGRS